MLILNAGGLQIRPSGINTLPANAQPGMTDKAELERILKNEEKK